VAGTGEVCVHLLFYAHVFDHHQSPIRCQLRTFSSRLPNARPVPLGVLPY
jgi:hypothetical protein